ncbi:type I restriction enzyme HsdR N-terminal domain-containing protein [uncultured Roseovarius sp.]|uniref:type I restriction enzyme HsdR N-terminal domain-containing protein n=1 Tax=uncultured Roseovarius sp. TaxID=293344 RepID=UPI00259218FE|nr:type I restriction enzyme HsdR N-terminal domain-containing protein [uncultured Roseovarius sp.]
MKIITDAAVKAAPSYNEAEIRFHIIDPVLRHLGYPGTDNVYLNLEEKLDYPYVHIGRRSKKDVPLGFPDYRAGLEGERGSFVIEAKAGNIRITLLEVEQAHSYAAHAQVGANYFVLCNGSIFSVYETLSGSSARPLAEIPLCELNERFHELENILSPTSLAKNCRVIHDKGLKLAEGLGSSVAIRSGRYVLEEYDYRFSIDGRDCTDLVRQNFPQNKVMEQQLELLKTSFELKVSKGTAERNPDGQIIAQIEFEGATTHNDKAMSIMGLKEATLATADKFLSIDPNNPTTFESLRDYSVAKGTMLPLLFGGEVEMNSDLSGGSFIKAAMHLVEDKLLGQYVAFSKQHVPIHGGMTLLLELDIAGTFELTIDR